MARVASTVLASLAILWISVAVLSEFWQQQDYGYNVQAALRDGERVDARAMTAADRLRLNFGAQPRRRIVLRIDRNGRHFEMPIESERVGNHSPDPIVYVGTPLALLLAAFIVGRRPSVMTAMLLWFVMSMMYPGPIVNAASTLSDQPFVLLSAIVLVVAGTPGSVALLGFVTRFPSTPQGKRQRLAMHVGDAIVLATLCAFILGGILLIAVPADSFYYTILPAAGLLLSLVGAIWRYAVTQGDERRRVAWVLAGVAAANISTALILFGTQLHAERVHPWYAQVGEAATLLLPLALGYAILKHHVLDLAFVVNRALVYSVVTIALAVPLTAVDFLVGRFLERSGWALLLEGAVAVTLGLMLRSVHAASERVLDRLVFRSRYIAEKRIQRQIEALRYTELAATIDGALVSEAPSVFKLTSAAVFFRDEGELAYTCRASQNWNDLPVSVDRDAFLIRSLRASESAIDLESEGISVAGAPLGDARPYLALPICARHELRGFAL